MNRTQTSPNPARFDGQGARFDKRAGLPDGVSRSVAAAALEMAGVGPGDRVLELGAGTGQIGIELARSGAAYLGLDSSADMLAQFAARAGAAGVDAELEQADGDAPWPIPDGSVRLVFCARAVHWMRAEHVVAELQRVGRSDGAALVLGRVARSGGVRAQMRRALQERLVARGYRGWRRERSASALEVAAAAAGLAPLEPTAVRRWQVTATPRSSLAHWRDKRFLGGADPSPAERAEILDELAGWAIETFGGLDHEVAAEERYVLSGYRTAA